jgi:S-(hydroxymethyl)glutathione dehydrogenase/alcohol dehydrogenase
MKAAVLRAVKQPLTIEDIQISKPGPREVLVRTVAAGVCHSDLHFQTGAYTYPMPAVLGTSRRASWSRSAPMCTTSRPATT